MVYLEAAIQGFFLKIVIRFRYTWGIPVGGSFPVKLQAYVCGFGGSGFLRGCFSNILLILLFFIVRTAVLGKLTLVAAS